MLRDARCVVGLTSITSHYPTAYLAEPSGIVINSYWYSGKCCYRDKQGAGSSCTNYDILDASAPTVTVARMDTNSIKSSLQNPDDYKSTYEEYQGSLLVRPPVHMTVPARMTCKSDVCLSGTCCQANVHPTHCAACVESTGACQVCSSDGLDRTSGCHDSCPRGMYCPGAGSEDPGKIKPCPAGKFNNAVGGQSLAACQTCAKGLYALEASSQCTSCPAGRFNSEEGGIDVKQSSSQSSCKNCNKGRYSEAGAFDCIDCGKGRYSEKRGAFTCFVCHAGLYSTDPELKDSKGCVKCDKGKFLADDGVKKDNHDEAADCQSCPIGYFQEFTGQSICFPCDGANEVGFHECPGCSPGKFKVVTPAGCEGCAPGSYSDDTDLSSCKSCPFGFYKEEAPFTSCTPCPSGKVGVKKGSGKLEECFNCPEGRFLDKEGVAAAQGAPPTVPLGDSLPPIVPCTECSRGKWNAVEGASSAADCTSCLVGKYNNLPAQTNVSACIACLPGFSSSVVGASTIEACLHCPQGYHQEDSAQSYCAKCLPGRHQPTVAQSSCKLCNEGFYNKDAGLSAVACKKCPVGTAALAKGQVECYLCIPGKYTAALQGLQECKKCPVGRYTVSQGHIGEECVGCPNGFAQDREGSASCLPCSPGKANNVEGRSVCTECIQNTYTSVAKQDDCTSCSTGQYTRRNGSTMCQECGAGSFGVGNGCKLCPTGWKRSSSDTNLTRCQECEKGSHQPEQGMTACLKCIPGTYQLEKKQKNCTMCAVGRASATAARKTECDVCTKGRKQKNKGMTVCLSCIPGKYQPQEKQSNCKSCVEGRYADLPQAWICKECTQGTDTENKTEAAACSGCDLGRYGAGPGLCVDCVDGKFIDERGSTACKEPASTLFVANDQRTAQRPIDYLVKSSCNTLEYLNATSNDPYDHACIVCPIGASCLGPVDQSEVRALFGFARCDTTLLAKMNATAGKYLRCEFPAACLGAANSEFQGKYQDEFGRDPALVDSNVSKCDVAYRKTSYLCSACNPNYSRSYESGLSGQCKECPPFNDNLTLIIVGINLIVLGLFGFVRLTLSDAGHLHDSDGIKSIGLSFLQVMALLINFPIAWPVLFIRIFKIGGAITAVGSHLVDLKCMNEDPDITEAGVFFGMSLIAAVTPLVIISSSIVVWTCLSKCCTRSSSTRRKHCGAQWCAVAPMNLLPRIRATVVALMYLLWPSLTTQTFAIWSCRKTCDLHERTFMTVSTDEVCWEGRHLLWSLGLGKFEVLRGWKKLCFYLFTFFSFFRCTDVCSVRGRSTCNGMGRC